MKSLGVIETLGLVNAIQVIDVVCKSAEVSCIGYRKPGAGRVCVCFEGEIGAIKMAIERGIEVAGMHQKKVASLIIARPERCVVEMLAMLKGIPQIAQTALPARVRESQTYSAPHAGELKMLAKKGKKGKKG